MDYTMSYSQQPCEANSIAVSTSQMRKLSLLIINAIAAHSEAPTHVWPPVGHYLKIPPPASVKSLVFTAGMQWPNFYYCSSVQAQGCPLL